MGRSCSVGGCTSGFSSNKTFKGTIYGFPLDKESDKMAWLKALPNYIDPAKVTVNMGVCELHWPPGVRMRKRHRWQVPDVPPSIFSLPSTFCPQLTSPPRDVDKRKVSAEARASSSAAAENPPDEDIIIGWDQFKSHCQELEHPIAIAAAGLTILGISPASQFPPTLIFSIFVGTDFKVKCYKNSSLIPVRHLINGFTLKLERFSQLRKIIIDYVASVDSLLLDELHSLEKRLTDLSNHKDVEEDLKHRLLFFASQLRLSTYKPNGRRYTPFDIKVAIDLFLRSRSCYSAARKTLYLPHSRTIKSLFGKIESPGSINECKETVLKVFSTLNDKQAYSKVLADEIHIRPSIRSQKTHVIGYSIDEPTKPAKTILALMVCPILGGPAFVARLIPVFSLKHDLLYDQLLKLIKIIHESGGYVFLAITDNLRANISCFEKFRKTFGGDFEYSVYHPVKNNIFPFLFLFFDTIHLFKNIKSNWITEKMKKLCFHNFETDEELTAEWKHIVDIYKEERDLIVKQTRLTYATIYPTNFDKQKVQLTFNVFNEKTVAVLKINGASSTETFVRLVTRMMNILNVKSPHTATKLNDPDRRVIRQTNDDRFTFLEDMACMFEKMDPASSKYPGRVKCLTSQTSKALSVTLRGVVEVSKTLLQKGVDYVMTGDLNDERLEGELVYSED